MYTDGWKNENCADLCLALLDISALLLLPRMSNLVGTVLATYVDETNVFDILDLSRLHTLAKLEESCTKVMALKIECIVHQTTDGRERFEAEILREAVAIEQLGASQVQTYSLRMDEVEENATDLPIVAEIRNVLNDYYCYIEDGDSEDQDEIRSDQEKNDTVTNTRYMRRERRDKLNLLDTVVRKALIR